MRRLLLATTILAMPLTALGQTLQSGTVGGMPYYLLPASGGCSAATPCSVVTYLSYMDESQNSTAGDVQQYFGGSFAQQNPHTVVIAPMITQPQDSNIDWGGYNILNTPQQQQMVGVVQSVEQSMGNTVNPKDSVVTGGSLGGNGTQAALVAYGPNGTVSPGVFSAGLSFDARLDTGNTQALCGVPLMAVHGTNDTDQSIATDQGLQSSIDGNPACNNSFTFVPVQGAGHGTWGGPSGYPAGSGSGTPLGWLGSELTALGSSPVTPAPAVDPAGGPAPVTTAATTPPSNQGALVPQNSLTSASASPAPTTSTTSNSPTPASTPTTIIPGGPSLTDAQGNVWLITASGSIQENGQWTPGGGGTSALTVQNGVVYGEDNSGKGWFNLSSNNQYWTSIPGPPAGTVVPSSTPAATSSAVPQSSGGTAATPAAASPVAAAASTTPTVPQTLVPATACDLASSGQFAEMGQTIYGPNQQPFVARGINIMEGQDPSVSEVLAAFPGVNFVRYAVYDYASPTQLAAYIQQFTDKGIVVELEDHTTSDGSDGGGQSGQVFSGSQLSNELAWYSSIATQFKSNPYVWFGTNNEPATSPSVAALSDWQQQTYQAIRSTGNNSPIMLETIIGGADMSTINAGMVQSDYSNMTNTIWDMHYYGWVTNYSTDQSVINQSIATGAAAAQQTTNAGGVMPVLIGEYGNSTTGMSIDPNGMQSVQGVESSGFGSAAWSWGAGNPGDGLTNGSTPTSPYGQQVASYIAGGGASGTASLAVACAANPAAANAAASGSTVTSAAPTPQNSLASIPAPAGAN
jgi:hypothetical protein